MVVRLGLDNVTFSNSQDGCSLTFDARRVRANIWSPKSYIKSIFGMC